MSGREGEHTTQARKILPPLIIKRRSSKRTQFIVLKKIRNTEYKNSIGVSESKFLTDATIPFQIKPWGYDETKNSDEKVSVGAFCVLKKLHLGGGNCSPICD